MANKKSNKKTNAEKVQERKAHNRRMEKGARFMAIFMIGIMVVFTFVTAGIFLLD